MDRRNFLKKIGLGVTGMAIAPMFATKENFPVSLNSNLLCCVPKSENVWWLFRKQIKIASKAGLKDPLLYYAIRRPNGTFYFSSVRKSELPTCNLVEDIQKHPHSGDAWQSSIFPLLKENPHRDPVNWNKIPSHLFLANKA